MGILMSTAGKALPTSQVTNFVFGTFCNQFVENETKDFDTFHIAVMEMLNAINVSLPGQHYDAPPLDEVQNLFKEWNEAKDWKKKEEKFMDFMKRNVKPSKVDSSMIFTGIVVPPVAMAAKRTGETLPQLKVVKFVPDVVFVPSMTILGLVTVKLSRSMFMRKRAS